VRVVLTGGAGFVGLPVARRVVHAGCELLAIVRPGREAGILKDLGDRVTVLSQDMRESEALAQALKEFEPSLCLHLAWYVVPGRYPTALDNLDSVTTSVGLVRALSRTSCRRFVFVGSSAEYAPADDCVDEQSAIEPRTLYTACKTAVSLMTTQVAAECGWTAVTARIFNIYGPREPEPRLVPSVIRALLAGRPVQLTSGAQVRDFLHVDDVADALWTVARSELTGTVNVASAVQTTVAAVATEIARQVGRPDLLQFGAVPTRSPDAAPVCSRRGRLHEELGWTPRFDLASGLAHTIEWWKRQIRERRAEPLQSGPAGA
jgi:nucleoside-diphosphate-sugar epimerase